MIDSTAAASASYYQRHIFFCLNERKNGEGCCAQHQAQQAFDHCKVLVKTAGLSGPGQVRVNKAGCLDRCAGGPVAWCTRRRSGTAMWTIKTSRRLWSLISKMDRWSSGCFPPPTSDVKLFWVLGPVSWLFIATYFVAAKVFFLSHHRSALQSR